MIRFANFSDHLTRVLGAKTGNGTLYSSPVDEELGQLPSPEALKKRVLIKAKKLPPGVDPDEADGGGEDSGQESEDDERDEKKKKVSKVRRLIYILHFSTADPFKTCSNGF